MAEIDRLKEIVESYTEVRKVYLDDMDKINQIVYILNKNKRS